MLELITIARPYAKAVFEYAQARKELAEWADVLQVLAMVATDKQAYVFLANPIIKREHKISLLLGFISDLGDNIKLKATNFLQLLAEYDRLTALPEIAQLYLVYRADYEKSTEVQVTSARPLDNEQQQNLIKALSRRLNLDVSLNVHIDDSLLGGAIIKVGDLVINGSVRGLLDNLSARLTV